VLKVASHTGVIHAQNKAFNAHSRPAGDAQQPASSFSLMLDDAAGGTSAAPKPVSEQPHAAKSSEPAAADDNQQQPTPTAGASAPDQQTTPNAPTQPDAADIKQSDKAAAVAFADVAAADDQAVTAKTDDSGSDLAMVATDAAPLPQQPLPATVITPATLVEIAPTPEQASATPTLAPDAPHAPGQVAAAPSPAQASAAAPRPAQGPLAAPTQPAPAQPRTGAPAAQPQVTPAATAEPAAAPPDTSAVNPRPVMAAKASVDKNGKTASAASAETQTMVATQAADPANVSTAPAADTAVAANDQHRDRHAAAEDKKDHAAIAAAAGRIGADNTELSTAPHTEIPAGDVAHAKAPDGMQILAVQHPAEGVAAASPATPAGSSPEAAAAAIPLAGLAVEIAARAQAGRNRFEIRLDPPELGRIDVRLDIDRGGHVTSRLTVDRVETLDALRRDAGDLQKALQDAGFKTADNGMQFTLRDHSFAGRDQSLPTAAAARVVVAPDLVVSDTIPAGYARLLRPGGGIDIRV
jgi:flagellar hook-length control protein FliK